MKKYAVFLALLVFIVQVSFAQDETKQCRINVKGMTCGGCVSRVKAACLKLDGVTDAKVSLADGIAEVIYASNKLSPNDLVAAIEKTGFSASFTDKPSPGGEKKYPIDITKEMGLPEGAKCQLTNEYDCPVSGYSKVKIVKLSLKPGTKIENFTVSMHAFCTATKGTLSVVTSDGKQMTVKEGDRWVDPKGTLYKIIENKGKSTAEDVMFMLAEEETHKH